MCTKLVYVRSTILLLLLGLVSSQGIISVGLEVQFPDKLCLKGSHFQFLKVVHLKHKSNAVLLKTPCLGIQCNL